MRISPNLLVEVWPRERLQPSPKNPRTHSRAQVASIAASIKTFGFVNPVLIDPVGEIIAGEGRWLGAGELKLAEIPVIVLGHLSPTERLA